LVGTATTAPYSVALDTTALANTSHSIYAKAYDVAGNSSNSGSVTFTINNLLRVEPTWANGFGGAGSDYGATVVVDGGGNNLVAGVFSGTVDFGGTALTSAGGYDIFVAKYSPGGALAWVKRFGSSTASEVAKCMALDASGNIFIGGTLVGGSLMKLDPNGNLLWTKAPVGGYPNNVDIASLATDSQGNVIATGSFNSMYPGVDFGDGHLLYSQNNSTDTYLAKYSPTGTCLWAQRFNNSGDVEYGTGVAVDKRNDNILLTGYAFNGIDLGGGGFGNGSWGACGFLGKFSPAGVHLWSRRVGSKKVTDETYAYGRARVLTVDSNGDVAVGGEFYTRSNLGGEPMDSGDAYVTSTAPNFDLFLVKYSGNDGRYIWSQKIIGDQDEKALSMTTDAQNNLIVTGPFRGTAHFDGQAAANQFQLTTTGADRSIYDIFVAKYSSAGVPVWAKNFGGTSDDGGNSVAVDASGSPVVTGYFQGNATFGTQSLTSGGGLDTFLMKLNPATGSIP